MSRPKGKLTLRRFLVILVCVAIVTSSVVVGIFNFQTTFEQKRRDLWAILYQEFEKRASEIFLDLTATASKTTRADAVVRFDKSKVRLVRGDINMTSVAKAKLRRRTKQHRFFVMGIDGEAFLVRKVGTSARDMYGFWRINLGKWLQSAEEVENGSTVYVANRNGDLLYSNRDDIVPANFQDRDLVQNFIKSPVTQFQSEMGSEGHEIFGFFREIKDTNMVLFAETPTDEVYREFRELVRNSIILLAIVIFATVGIMQIPLRRAIDPIRELVEHAEAVAKGEFDVRVKKKGFGEISILTESFEKMVVELGQREKRIKALMVEQLEKSRLAAELEIAQRIQKNLLPQEPLPESSGLELASVYIPAEECAGDWYGYFHVDDRNETIVALADVSGHGAGSSMFAAIIAAIFDSHREASLKGAPFETDTFAFDVNRAMKNIGSMEWHATLQVLRFLPKDNVIEITNAGHCFPFITTQQGDKTRSVVLKSSILGLEEQPTLKMKRLKVPTGTNVVMYTDGLVEATSAAGKQLGSRTVRKLLQENRGRSSRQLIHALKSKWDGHLVNSKAQDDVCMLVMRTI